MVRYVQVQPFVALIALSLLLPVTIASPGETVTVKMSHPTFTVLESPSGLVTVRNGVGAPLAGIVVTITHVSGLIRHSIMGTTDANGEVVFDFALDMTARTPGPHDVFVTAATTITATARAQYLVTSSP